MDIKGTDLRLLKEQARNSESAQLAEVVAATEAGLEAAVAEAQSARKHKADMAASAQVCRGSSPQASMPCACKHTAGQEQRSQGLPRMLEATYYQTHGRGAYSMGHGVCRPGIELLWLGRETRGLGPCRAACELCASPALCMVAALMSGFTIHESLADVDVWVKHPLVNPLIRHTALPKKLNAAESWSR